MNRTTFFVIATLAAAAILVPTGAAPFDLLGTDEVPDGEIEMAPADGPHGSYAVLNENDKLELLLTDANPSIDGDGIPENAIVPIDRVFTITYTGEEYAEVWITDDADDVRFYRGDVADQSIEGRENNVTLEPNGTVAVGLVMDTRGEHDIADAETFGVHARIAEPTTPSPDEPSSASGGGAPPPTVTETDTVTSTETATETETSTPTPTEAATETTTSTGTETTETGATGATTLTETATETTESSSTTATTVDEPGAGTGTESGGGALIEFGGVGVTATALAALLVLFLAMLVALLAIRRYR
ncbi:DUF1102 domain-containing protein [Halorhabdus amylolytica]|uniref:DUF1102 domain-containing protein n=1 Tax=Halorhabdus amylolytica TaxID=2559573 RepID=UPI0010AA8107|nr:DUF1102 domain-containing protein [Halorhabdus amylolytica]